MAEKTKAHNHYLHKAGMILSVLCIIHCLSMPVLVTLLPLFAGKYFTHEVEIYVIIASLIIAVYLLNRDYKKHRKSLPFILLGLAGVIQLAGLFLMPATYETLLVVGGSLILLAAYWINFRLHRQSCSYHHH